jgi:hypothetical protein
MEIYAKSSTGKVILAKRVGGGELYLQVGRKNASLTDAERESFAKKHRCTVEGRTRADLG